MADTVRYIMEEMVPELEEFVKQRYFSRKEVKQIVKRRQEFEYALKRRAALKEDYLRCAAHDEGGRGRAYAACGAKEGTLSLRCCWSGAAAAGGCAARQQCAVSDTTPSQQQVH
jgi:hypothetical protein